MLTEDGVTITNGMRLYNYYDGKWGIVHFDSETVQTGWFDLHQEDGTKAYLNGQRVCSYNPRRN